MNRFYQAILKVADAGTSKASNKRVAGKVWLTNVIVLTLIGMLLAMLLFFLIALPVMVTLVLLAVTMAVLSTWLLANKLGFFNVARYGVIVSLSGAAVFSCTQYIQPVPELKSAITGALIAFIALPLILFDIEERRAMALGLVLPVLAYFVIDPIDPLIQLIDFYATGMTPEKMAVSNRAVVLFSFVILIACFLYLHYIQRTAYQQVEALLSESNGRQQQMEEQEQSLLQQNEELLASQALMEEIQEQLQAETHQAVQAQQALEHSQAELQKRQQELEAQRQRDKTVADFDAILRDNLQKNLSEFADACLLNMCELIGALQGVIYLEKESADGHTRLQAQAGFACQARLLSELVFDKGEGIVGQCYKDGLLNCIDLTKTMQRELESGLTSVPCQQLLVVPLQFNQQTLGVAEFVLPSPLLPENQQTLVQLCTNMAATLQNLLNRERLEKVLGRQHTERAALSIA